MTKDEKKKLKEKYLRNKIIDTGVDFAIIHNVDIQKIKDTINYILWSIRFDKSGICKKTIKNANREDIMHIFVEDIFGSKKRRAYNNSYDEWVIKQKQAGQGFLL